MGVSTASLYDYQLKFPEILDALKRGKAPVDTEVENALLKRARGYEYEETTTEIFDMPDGTQRKHIKKTKKFIPPDTMAAIYWLNNRKPDQWKNRKAVDIETSNMEPVKVIVDV